MPNDDCAPVGLPLLFKVLVGGRPCHGGKFRYRVGEWTPAIAEPRCCRRGYHLTSDPLGWWRPKAQVFLAAGRGARDFGDDNDDKCAFESVYLVQEVTRRWPYLPMFPRLRAFLAASARSFSKRANIRWADLDGTDLSGGYLEEANLRGCDLGSVNFASATLNAAILASANMACSNLSQASLLWVWADRVNLTAANLTRVVAKSSVFTRAKLIRTQLSGAYLERVDLTRANCQDADFHDAVLTRAVLRKADFTNADLAGTELEGADVTGANFSGARRRPDDPPIPGWTLENGRLRRTANG